MCGLFLEPMQHLFDVSWCVAKKKSSPRTLSPDRIITEEL